MKNMKKKTILIFIGAVFISIGIFALLFNQARENDFWPSNMTAHEQNRMNQNNMMMGEDEQNIEIEKNTQSENELFIPPLLNPDSENAEEVTYSIVAKEGEFQIKEGNKTKTLGYNNDFLGPVLRLKKGQKVTINTLNQLDTNTSFHWHGLKIPSDVDGGPHQVVKPGETKTITFTVEQEAATLWFHPHPEGETAEQVYKGLAGLMYVEDENSNLLNIPKDYGVDDIPLIVQDKPFDKNNQLNYESDFNSDGTQGDTLLVNGTINPSVEVNDRWIRYRIVNGSNSRNFTFSLNDNQSFYQIASDGGLLNSLIELNSLTLSAGERAEIVVDTKAVTKGNTIQLMTDNSVALTMKVNETRENVEFNSSLKMNSIDSIDRAAIDKLDRQTIDLKGMSHMVSINNKQFERDRIDIVKKVNTQEIWEVNNISDMMGGMIHPFHIHGVQFQILSRNGQTPSENELGWKDTVSVKPDEKVELLVRFDHTGVFMYHCHILEHEESGMMGQVEVN